MRGEGRIHTKGKKGWSLLCVSTTFVHDCSKAYFDKVAYLG